MRAFLRAATCWQAAVLCASNVSSFSFAGPEIDSPSDILAVAGSIGADSSLTVNFPVRCPACSDDTGGSLNFELTIPASQLKCGLDSPLVNGVSLDNLTRGNEYLVSNPANPTHQIKFLADWTNRCVNDTAAVLSLQVTEDLDHGIDWSEPVGFTVSYYQGLEPLILRLSDGPVDIRAEHERNDYKSWLDPDKEHRVTIIPSGPIEDSRQILNQEFQKLELLKAEFFHLWKAVHHQEKKILHLIKPNMQGCSGLKCMFQKALQKLPDLTHLISTHFRFQPSPAFAQKANVHKNCSRAGGSAAFEVDSMHDELDGPAGYQEQGDHPIHDPPPPSTPPHGVQNPHSPVPPVPPHPPMHPDHPEPPKLPTGHPPYHLPHEGFPHLGHGSPNFPSEHHRHHFIKGGVIVVLVVLILALCFRHSAHREHCISRCRKRRADRAARREERQAQREHRRAARRHKLASWWSRYRKPASTADYDEKRALILQQEDVLENAMQGDINTLRSAHEIVGEMMRAEEGRARLYFQANQPPSGRPVAELDVAGIGSSRGRRRSTSSTYTQPPPLYEEELEGEMTVVDGFSYTPSATDDTPDSSVVDCSPRLSFETGTTVMTREFRE